MKKKKLYQIQESRNHRQSFPKETKIKSYVLLVQKSNLTGFN